MINKKYILLAGLTAVTMNTVLAQESSTSSQWTSRDMTYRGNVYDALDTAYVPKGRMDQQIQYLNHQYAYPAKPRNMWELGINVGQTNIIGDVTSKSIWNAPKFHEALSFGATLRKALGYSTSLRLSYNFMNAAGYDYRQRDMASNDAVWGDYYNGPGTTYFANYKFSGHEATLQFLVNTNNIRFHKAKNSLSLYGFVGAGMMFWQTKVSTKNANGVNYNFDELANIAENKERNKTYKGWLKDSEYNVQYTKDDYTGGGKLMTWGTHAASVVANAGVGVQFKLGDRVSLSIEDKLTYTGLDGLDAITLEPTPSNGLSAGKDLINNFSIGLGFNLGNKKRSVLPLWWVNPLDHAYNELSNPRHMELPAPVLPDSDGDGVTDQFDKCPDTPAGVAVDVNGCPLDTDGDGVPDYRDKQLITPTDCQPVDADGVGNCPCPDDCKGKIASGCNITPSVLSFKSNSAALSTEIKNQLAVVAAGLKADPSCKIVVVGNAGSSKLQQQRSWDRVNAVIEYLANTLQISRDQFIFQYQGETGDTNNVIIRSAQPGEEGPSNLPPPHPHLGTKK
jgi:OOP family OmpA-OmpF porin